MPALPPTARPGWARFGGVSARGALECVDLSDDVGRARVDEDLWFVSLGFEGTGHAWRFAEVTRDDDGAHDASSAVSDYPRTGWRGPSPDAWGSSATDEQYRRAVDVVRASIRAGQTYQVNVCRVLDAPLPVGVDGAEPDAASFAALLARENPAPHAGWLHVPASSGLTPAWLVSASPELFLRRDGDRLTSRPIKGTAPTAAGLLPKDEAENVMIVDMVRNDLLRVCAPGSVEVEALLALEEHPGLVHLVSTVAGNLRGPGVGWAQILDATFPPASVSGTPKQAALDVIAALEPAARGPYCGAFGWIDGDARRAELAVAIRTFWWADGVLRFGTGAGITWGSDPDGEWHETELKARRLVGLASKETA